MKADSKAFEAMVMPMLQMFEAALPEVKTVKSESGKFVEKTLKDVLGSSPLYPMVRKFILNQIEENPDKAEQVLIILSNRLNQWIESKEVQGRQW